MQVQVLYIKSPDYVAPLSPPGTNNVEISELRNNSGAPYSALVGAGLPCACVDVAKTRLLPVVDQRFGPRTSPGESPSAERIVDATPGLVPLRKQYAALQEGCKNSSVGQLPEEILSRVMKETSSLESAPSTFFKVSFHAFVNIGSLSKYSGIICFLPFPCSCSYNGGSL